MRRSNAKNPVRRDESKRSSLAGSVIAQRLLRQHIQLAGAGVALNLTIPGLDVELGEPRAKFRHLRFRDVLDFLFQLFDFAHGKSSVRLRGILPVDRTDGRRPLATQFTREQIY